MMKLPMSGFARWLRTAGVFLFGLTLGFVLAGAGSTLWADEDGDRAFKKRTLYALAQLAIDTETVASNLVRLEQRVDDLEAVLEESLTPKQ